MSTTLEKRPATAPVEETWTAPKGAATRPPLRSRILIAAGLAVAAVYFLLPVYWMAVSSTKSTKDLFGTFGLWFADPRFLANMGDLFTHDGGIFTRWIGNTLLYAGVGSAVSTLVAAMAGYALAKYEFTGREAVFNVILAGVLLPGTALALPLFLLFSKVDLANTYWAVLLPQLVTPFGVYLTRVYAQASVPDELLEAARLDGAGEVRIFFTLVLRILSPALVTVFLFQFVHIWNNYFLPLVMLSDSKLYPVTLGLTSWQSYADRQPELYQLTIGGALVSVVPIMIAMVSMQRFFANGLTEGSVKG